MLQSASFAQARDELFSHILRCGVIDALPEHQQDCSTIRWAISRNDMKI